MPLSDWSVSSSVMTNQIMLHMSRSSIERGVSSLSSSCWISERHLPMSSGESWIPIHPDRSYFAMRSAERRGSLRPLK